MRRTPTEQQDQKGPGNEANEEQRYADQRGLDAFDMHSRNLGTCRTRDGPGRGGHGTGD